MFYAADILGRKTPLGAIWTLAHGKKLSKGKIIKIHLPEIIKQILQPDVPHSLRLQAIMINGVVKVFDKQTLYLLEDLRGMLKQVKTLAARQPGGPAALLALGGDSDGGGGPVMAAAGRQPNLARAKQTARPDAITLPTDLEALHGRAAFSLLGAEDDDLLSMMQNQPDADANNVLAEDLFVLTLGEEEAVSGPRQPHPSSSGGGPAAANAPAQQPPLLAAFTMPGGGLLAAAGADFDWPAQDDLMDETFEVPPMMEGLLLDGEEGAFDQQQQGFDQPGGSPLLHGQGEPMEGVEAALEGGEEPGAKRRRGGAASDTDTALSDSCVLTEEDSATMPATAAKQRSRRATSVKRRGGATLALLIDAPNALQIGSAQYRQWTRHAGELAVGRRFKRRRLAGDEDAEADEGDVLTSGRPAAFNGGELWCPELLALFAFCARLPEPGPAASKKKGPPAGGQGQEQQEEWGRAFPSPAGQHHDAPAVAGEEAQQYAHQDLDLDMMAPDEQLDQLGDLPFADMEAERLRAAATPQGADAQRGALGLSPGGATGGRRAPSRQTDRSGSTLAPTSLKSFGNRQGSGDIEGLLQGAESPLLFNGAGSLEDLLPAVPLALDGSGARGNRPFGQSFPTDLPTSQFPLLEESATQGQGAAAQLHQEALSRQTALAITIFRNRLTLAAGADEDEGEEGGGGGPRLSLFDLVARLSRAEGAKLFYQVCVTCTAGYVQAEQGSAYGDITIRAGRRL